MEEIDCPRQLAFKSTLNYLLNLKVKLVTESDADEDDIEDFVESYNHFVNLWCPRALM